MFRKILFTGFAVFLAGILTAHAGDNDQGGTRRHLLIMFSSTNGVLRVEKAQRVNLPLPKARKGSTAGPWRFSLIDAKGKPLYERGMGDPSVIRGEFPNSDDPDKIDSAHVTEPGPIYFSVRMPDIRAARIKFRSLKPGIKRAAIQTEDAWQPQGSVAMPAAGGSQ